MLVRSLWSTLARTTPPARSTSKPPCSGTLAAAPRSLWRCSPHKSKPRRRSERGGRQSEIRRLRCGLATPSGNCQPAAAICSGRASEPTKVCFESCCLLFTRTQGRGEAGHEGRPAGGSRTGGRYGKGRPGNASRPRVGCLERRPPPRNGRDQAGVTLPASLVLRSRPCWQACALSPFETGLALCERESGTASIVALSARARLSALRPQGMLPKRHIAAVGKVWNCPPWRTHRGCGFRVQVLPTVPLCKTGSWSRPRAGFVTRHRKPLCAAPPPPHASFSTRLACHLGSGLARRASSSALRQASRPACLCPLATSSSRQPAPFSPRPAPLPPGATA